MSDAPTLTKTLLNGVKLNCPSCGAGEIFASYLKRRDACPHCGESFVGLDADDGPAWLTIGIAAHIVVPLLIFLERREWLGYYAEFLVVALATIANFFASYLKRRDACPHCGESFVGLDADDGPAWLTVGIAVHIVVPLLIFLERREWLGYYAEFLVVALTTVAIVLLVLPRSKGFWISILWWNSKRRELIASRVRALGLVLRAAHHPSLLRATDKRTRSLGDSPHSGGRGARAQWRMTLAFAAR